MNGIYNTMFIVLLMFFLVAVDWMMTIGDDIVFPVNSTISNMTMAGLNNSTLIKDLGSGYVNARAVLYTSITGVFVPFLIFLTLISSFINRTQDLTIYIVSSLAVMLATPLAIYVFSDIISNMLNVTLLDPQFMATSLISNFVPILIANMLLSFGSFVFLVRGIRA